MKSLPIFTSHYSIGNSILTLKEASDDEEEESSSTVSIFDIAKKHDLTEVFLLETGLSGFISARKQCLDQKLNLRVGIKIVVCEDLKKKNADSLNTEHKVVLWAKNDAGYYKLVKLLSKAATDGFYYRPRIDCNHIKELWDDNDLILQIPFYYSYIHQNLLYGAKCVPDFNFTNIGYMMEHNRIPFNFLLSNGIDSAIKNNGGYKLPVKSIYYENKEDFIYYQAFKCLHNRTTLEMPNLDHLCSDEFCMESWRGENL